MNAKTNIFSIAEGYLLLDPILEMGEQQIHEKPEAKNLVSVYL